MKSRLLFRGLLVVLLSCCGIGAMLAVERADELPITAIKVRSRPPISAKLSPGQSQHVADLQLAKSVVEVRVENQRGRLMGVLSVRGKVQGRVPLKVDVSKPAPRPNQQHVLVNNAGQVMERLSIYSPAYRGWLIGIIDIDI